MPESNNFVEGVPRNYLVGKIEELLDLPDEGSHEIGFRYPEGHPLAGQKERYLKKSGTLNALFNYVGMALRSREGEKVLRGCQEEVVGRLKTIFSKRTADGKSLITDRQIALARNAGAFSLALLQGDSTVAQGLWLRTEQETNLDEWKEGYLDPGEALT